MSLDAQGVAGHPVLVNSLGIVVVAGHGQSVMDAAHEAGYFWPTVCNGEASCATCVCVVDEGSENCGPMPADELETLTRSGLVQGGKRRLACRLTVTGPVTVTKGGVHPAQAPTPTWVAGSPR